MSLLLLEGFEAHRDTDQLALKWNGSVATSVGFNTPGRQGWGYYSDHLSLDSYFRDGTHKKLFAGCAVYMNDTDPHSVIEFRRDGQKEMQLYWNGNNNGRRLQVFRNNVLVGDITTFQLQMNTWYWVEFMADSHNTTGAWEVRVNGTTLATGSSQDTQVSGEPNRVIFDQAAQQQMDDLYVCDDQGAQWNTFAGEIVIPAAFPAGAGNYTQFTPSAGSNYQNVDENPTHDGDTTYNASSTAGHKDSFSHGGFSIAGTYLGAMVHVFHRKDDAGSRNARALIRSGTTDSAGTTDISADTYTASHVVAEVDPNGGGSWNKTAMDAAEIGYELVS